MIITQYDRGVVNNKDNAKVMEILNKLKLDYKKYIVDIDYSPEGSDEFTSIGYVFKAENGKYIYTCETLKN